jgi:hypothetical protein
MNLPNAIIVGGQKCGSSWLLENLRKHSEVFGVKKEIHYFDKKDNFEKGVSWYASHFEDATPEHKIKLEKTPDYLFNGEAGEGHIPGTAKRIHEQLPECKILIILRNPAVRAISAVQHIIRSGRIPAEVSLQDVLLGEKEYLVKEHGVIEYGFYADHVQEYINLFGQDEVLVLIYEEVMNDKDKALRDVFRFLQLNGEINIVNQEAKVNAPSANRFLLILKYYAPFMTKIGWLKKLKPYFKGSSFFREKDNALVDELLPIYENDIRQLASIMGRNKLWGYEVAG